MFEDASGFVGRRENFEAPYAYVYAYNVLNISQTTYKSRGHKVGMIIYELETRKEAEDICKRYNGTSHGGRKIHIAIRRPPSRHLSSGSWDSSHNRAHNQPRDLGSAKGTNFESVWFPRC